MDNKVVDENDKISYCDRLNMIKGFLETGETLDIMKHSELALKNLIDDLFEIRMSQFYDLYLNCRRKPAISKQEIKKYKNMNDIVLGLSRYLISEGLYDPATMATLSLFSGALLYKSGDITGALSALYATLEAGTRDPEWGGADDDVYIWSLIIDCMSHNEDHISAFCMGVKFLDERSKDFKEHLPITACLMFQCGMLALRFSDTERAKKYLVMASEEFEKADWKRNSRHVKNIIAEYIKE